MITPRSLEAGQRFLLAAKKWWTADLYQHLRREYEAQAGESAGRHDVADVAEVLEDLTEYRYFAWLERHLQRMKYSGAYGLHRYYDQLRDTVMPKFDEVKDDADILELKRDLPLPRYYTGVDIHQHPGGVWSDEVAGLVYEHGARSTTPMLGAAHADLHTRFTDLVGKQGAPARILDLGCGFGKSTQPFYSAFPKAQVEAIDLSAPCLQLAAHTAKAAGAKNVHFRQRDAVSTGYSPGSFDLVTSTMLLHETPPAPLDSLIAEAARVLEPGGRMIHLDFHHLPDAFARFMFYGHGRRNNEPYMQPFAEVDLQTLLKRHGFENITIEPFSEAEGIGAHRTDVWRLPWTVISARKSRSTPKRKAGSALRRGGKGVKQSRASRT
jgi:ubiquinone/menaquinone biosynthesis C-methylase UbiE